MGGLQYTGKQFGKSLSAQALFVQLVQWSCSPTESEVWLIEVSSLESYLLLADRAVKRTTYVLSFEIALDTTNANMENAESPMATIF